MNPITQRDAFWDRVYDLALADEDVVIVSADMAAPALDKFRKKLPSQFINVGIAEQDAILISTGLALEGKKVFTYAIAPFITYRCYDQIKLYLASMNTPITLVGVGAGFSYDDSGPTHHTIEDISILRILPHMTIHNMTDSVMAAAFAEISCGRKSPNYVRLDRKVLHPLYAEEDDFSRGVKLHREGKDIAILATGNMVYRGLEVAEELEKKGIDAGVIDVYAIPINADALLEDLRDRKKIFTLEEHTLPGGFGSAVLEVLSDRKKDISVRRFGLDMSGGYCYKYGGRDNMQSLYGLDKESIVTAIMAEL